MYITAMYVILGIYAAVLALTQIFINDGNMIASMLIGCSTIMLMFMPLVILVGIWPVAVWKSYLGGTTTDYVLAVTIPCVAYAIAPHCKKFHHILTSPREGTSYVSD